MPGEPASSYSLCGSAGVSVSGYNPVQYIILDEGSSALDEANASDIENNLLNTPQLGVIIITHNLRDSIREQLTAVYQL